MHKRHSASQRHKPHSSSQQRKQHSASQQHKPHSTSQKYQRHSASQQDLEFLEFGQDSKLLLKAFQASLYGQNFLTHKFHAYPGRFHPKIAHTLFEGVAKTRQKVFDPFMGGGTVLVEGMLKNLEVFGNDLNPVALLIAQERTRLLKYPSHAVSHAERIAERVIDSRKNKQRRQSQRKHLHALKSFYPPHIFVEAVAWIDAIDALEFEADRQTLRAVFSSLVVKYSYCKSDSQAGIAEQKPQYPKGAFSRMMVSKTKELVEAQTKFSQKVSLNNTPSLFCKDISYFNELEKGTIDLILSSPPYPGIYDYYEHHKLRMQWLDLPFHDFQKNEMGARRFGVSGRWREQFRQVLLRMRKLLKPSGSCYLVMGDWIEGSRGVNAFSYFKKYADSVGLEVKSAVSIRRNCNTPQQQKVFEEQGKWEHLIHLKQ